MEMKDISNSDSNATSSSSSNARMKYVLKDSVSSAISEKGISAITAHHSTELTNDSDETDKEYESTSSSETVVKETALTDILMKSSVAKNVRNIEELRKMNEKLQNEIRYLRQEMHSKTHISEYNDHKSEMRKLNKEFIEHKAKTNQEKKMRAEQIQNLFDGMSILQKTMNKMQNEMKKDRVRYKKHLRKQVELLRNLHHKFEEHKSSKR